MLSIRLNGPVPALVVALTLSATGSHLQAQTAMDFQSLKRIYEQCDPARSVGQMMPFDPAHASPGVDFIWLSHVDDANEPNCLGRPLSILANVVHNRSDVDLIFKWDKGGIWADKWGPLPKGISRGEPAPFQPKLAYSLDDAPILYGQNYQNKAPALAYVLSASNQVSNPTGSPSQKTEDTLKTNIKTAARTDKGIVEVLVGFTSTAHPERIYNEINIYSPRDATVAISQIPDYLFKMEKNAQQQTFQRLRESLENQKASFSISSLKELIGTERSAYAPKSLVDTQYLALKSFSDEHSIRFELPLSEGAQNEFDAKHLTSEIASVVVLDANGGVLGNGRVSLWLPALRK
jgi:hypothetical protein